MWKNKLRVSERARSRRQHANTVTRLLGPEAPPVPTCGMFATPSVCGLAFTISILLHLVLDPFQRH